MNYLEAAVFLKRLIKTTNSDLLSLNKNGLVNKNQMVIRSNFGNPIKIKMDAFSNEFVSKTLNEYDSEAFVITDLVTVNNKGQELTYFLYKGYHSLFDKGLVYFQLINKTNMQAIGELEFSNLEDNIFYNVQAPNFEESSCNAIETKENTIKEPSIAFLIGHMNEDRLFYDINRLIFDTANNVQKHKNRHFKFHIEISKFGGKLSPEFLSKLDALKLSLDKYITPEYPNSTFIFDLAI